MKPHRSDDAVVDLLDVILRDGVIVEADVIVTVADVPLVGISLRAAVAGMATMEDYGLLEMRSGGGGPAVSGQADSTPSESEAPIAVQNDP